MLDPGFDLGSNFVPDAFEATLLDAVTGVPVVASWDPAATSFFNIQEDGTAFMGPETIWSGATITVDLPAGVSGTQVVLYFDFIGADFDTTGGLRIDNVVLEPDNCPEAANPDQSDSDGDGAGDACDCAPSDPTAFAVPFEVTGVLKPGDAMSWDSAATLAGSGTVHDVVRGLVDELPVGAGLSETCLASGLPASLLTDLETPPYGSNAWYLVRGRNICGIGTYGFRSNGIERVSDACPEAACAPLPGDPTLLMVETANGGADLRFTWTDAVNADSYVLYDDAAADDSFIRAVGAGADGATGLEIPMPDGSRYYLLAGKNTCGLGAKR